MKKSNALILMGLFIITITAALASVVVTQPTANAASQSPGAGAMTTPF